MVKFSRVCPLRATVKPRRELVSSRKWPKKHKTKWCKTIRIRRAEITFSWKWCKRITSSTVIWAQKLSEIVNNWQRSWSRYRNHNHQSQRWKKKKNNSSRQHPKMTRLLKKRKKVRHWPKITRPHQAAIQPSFKTPNSKKSRAKTKWALRIRQTSFKRSRRRYQKKTWLIPRKRMKIKVKMRIKKKRTKPMRWNPRRQKPVNTMPKRR